MDAYAHQWFDPALFFIVCYDQRGAGGSVPNAVHDLDGALFENTTQHLVDDLDTLRVFGSLVVSSTPIVFIQLSLYVPPIYVFSFNEDDFIFQRAC